MGDARGNESGEGAYDLFDRWLAHREGAGEGAGDAEREQPTAAPAATFENPLFADTTTAPAVAPEVVAPELREREDSPLLPGAPAAPAAPEPDPAPARTSEHDAARAVVAAFAEQPATEQVAPAPASPPPPPPPPTREPLVAEGMPAVVEFAPRRGVRRVVGVLLLLALAATVLTAYLAWQDRTTTSIGIAATFGVLTGIIWAVRSGSSVAVLSVRGGMLIVERAGGRHQFDLASHYTPVEIVGEPGSRGWKVLFVRRSMAPFVIDASMVDPVEFTRVVRYYRPED
ncbi:hypothetical protein H5V45_14070 [Nocardioides sp. KIGAM211]|uniref:Uncharacterized protein n=1 Tax=Nocardioides luti TaxID=2761101 RepID=A0A7X0RHM0_9ACTN|nr:hypothetical protein [Nocardioides luti]MBB6628447.1 hypothetical protein [Nocardioides luti]